MVRPQLDSDPVTQSQVQPEAPITCRECGQSITSYSSLLEVNGSSERTFRNPAGYSFHVLCFGRAPGCLEVSAPIEADSWFAGYAWSIAVCQGCQRHLGWRYLNPRQDSFYGLIATRLRL